jgi:hypothetical protein
VLLYVQTKGLDAGEDVALVVRDAAGVEGATPDRGLERFALPQVEGLGRLHVVVAVGEEGAVAASYLGVDDRVPFGLHDADFRAGVAQLVCYPLGAPSETPVLVRAGGDRGHPQELLQLRKQGVLRFFYASLGLHQRSSVRL